LWGNEFARELRTWGLRDLGLGSWDLGRGTWELVAYPLGPVRVPCVMLYLRYLHMKCVKLSSFLAQVCFSETNCWPLPLPTFPPFQRQNNIATDPRTLPHYARIIVSTFQQLNLPHNRAPIWLKNRTIIATNEEAAATEKTRKKRERKEKEAMKEEELEWE